MYQQNVCIKCIGFYEKVRAYITSGTKQLLSTLRNHLGLSVHATGFGASHAHILKQFARKKTGDLKRYLF